MGAAATLIAARPVSPVTGRIAYVTDGDTFRLDSGERIRIAGIDAAETQEGNAKCARELVIGA
jgi:endonuclease YncB( thermonuclease family)